MVPVDFLGRVLRSEVDVSSLLAYCASVDPVPLQRVLELSEPITGVRVEVQYGKRSRLDVVLDGEEHPQAVLELKVSATEHGDQLARYDEFAVEHGARKFLVDLELPGTRVPDGWTRLNLADVFGCWEHSSNLTAQAFAGAIADVFRTWTAQVRGPFRDIEAAMLTVVLRSLANDLTSSGIHTISSTTSAGQPCLVAFVPHPSGTEHAYLSIDIRCQDKKNTMSPWLLRPGVHVDKGTDVAAARRLAHQLASELEPALALDLLSSELHTYRPGLGAAIGGERILKSPRDRVAAIERWLSTVSDPDVQRTPKHPVYHHDWGRRLAAQFTLDVPTLVPDDLSDIVRATMEHLVRSAIPLAGVPTPQVESDVATEA